MKQKIEIFLFIFYEIRFLRKYFFKILHFSKQSLSQIEGKVK